MLIAVTNYPYCRVLRVWRDFFLLPVTVAVLLIVNQTSLRHHPTFASN